MSVRMRHTRAHTRNRRSHHALDEPRLSKCGDCGHMHVRHEVCENCGKYRGRQVIDAEKRSEREERRKIAKLKSLGKYEGKDSLKKDEDEAMGPLDAEELSKKK